VTLAHSGLCIIALYTSTFDIDIDTHQRPVYGTNFILFDVALSKHSKGLIFNADPCTTDAKTHSRCVALSLFILAYIHILTCNNQILFISFKFFLTSFF